MPRFRQVRRGLAAVLATTLLLVLVPVAGARPFELAVSACRLGEDLQITVAWTGVTVDHVGFGVGSRGPGAGGLGFVQPVTAASSGLEAALLPAEVEPGDEMDVAGGTIYFSGGDTPTRMDRIASKSLNRPRTGWAACA